MLFYFVFKINIKEKRHYLNVTEKCLLWVKINHFKLNLFL